MRSVLGGGRIQSLWVLDLSQLIWPKEEVLTWNCHFLIRASKACGVHFSVSTGMGGQYHEKGGQ